MNETVMRSADGSESGPPRSWREEIVDLTKDVRRHVGRRRQEERGKTRDEVRQLRQRTRDELDAQRDLLEAHTQTDPPDAHAASLIQKATLAMIEYARNGAIPTARENIDLIPDASYLILTAALIDEGIPPKRAAALAKVANRFVGERLRNKVMNGLDQLDTALNSLSDHIAEEVAVKAELKAEVARKKAVEQAARDARRAARSASGSGPGPTGPGASAPPPPPPPPPRGPRPPDVDPGDPDDPDAGAGGRPERPFRPGRRDQNEWLLNEGEELKHEQLMTFDADMFYMEKIQPSTNYLGLEIRDTSNQMYYEKTESGRLIAFHLYDVRRLDDYPDDIRRQLIARSVLAQIISERSMPGMTDEDMRLLRSLDNEGIREGLKGRFEVYFDALKQETFTDSMEPAIVSREFALAADLGKRREDLTDDERATARYREGEEAYAREMKIAGGYAALTPAQQAEARQYAIDVESAEQENETFQRYRSSVKNIALEFIWQAAGSSASDPKIEKIRQALKTIGARMDVMPYGNQTAYLNDYKMYSDMTGQDFIGPTIISKEIALAEQLGKKREDLTDDERATARYREGEEAYARENGIAGGYAALTPAQQVEAREYAIAEEDATRKSLGTLGVGREFIQYKHKKAKLKHGIGELDAAIDKTARVVDSVTTARKSLASPDGETKLLDESGKINIEDIVWMFHEDPYLQRATRMVRKANSLQTQVTNRTLTQRYGEIDQGLTEPEEVAFASLFAFAEQLRLEDVAAKEAKRIADRIALLAAMTPEEQAAYIEVEETRRLRKEARGLVSDAEIASERNKNRTKRTIQVAYALSITKDGSQIARLLESYDGYLTAQRYDEASGKFERDFHYSGSQGGSGIEKTLESLLPWFNDYRWGRDRANGRAFWSIFIPRRLKRQTPFRERTAPSHADYYRVMDMEDSAIMNGGSDEWLDFTEENMTIKDLAIKAVAPYDRLGGWRTDQMRPHIKRMEREAVEVYGISLGTIEFHEYVLDQLMIMGGPRLVQQYIDAHTEDFMKLDPTGTVSYDRLDVKEVTAYVRALDGTVLNTTALQDVRRKILSRAPLTYADIITLKSGLDAYTSVKRYGKDDERRFEQSMALLSSLSASMEGITDEARSKYYTIYVFDEVQRRMPSAMVDLQSRKLTPEREKLVIDDVLNYLMTNLPSEITSRENSRAFVQNHMVPMFLMAMNLVETRRWEKDVEDHEAQLRADVATARAGGVVAPRARVIQGSMAGGVITRDSAPVYSFDDFDTDTNLQGMLRIIHKRFNIAIGEISPEEDRSRMTDGQIASLRGFSEVEFIDLFKDFAENGLFGSLRRTRFKRSAAGSPVEDLSQRFGRYMALDIGSVRSQLTDICGNDRLEVQQAGLTAQGRFVGTIGGLKENTAGFTEEQTAIKELITTGKGASDVPGALAGPLGKILKSVASDPDQRREWALRHTMLAIAGILPPPEFRGSSSTAQIQEYIQRYGAQISMFGDALAADGAIVYAPDRIELLNILKGMARHPEIQIPIASRTAIAYESEADIIAAGGLRGRTVKFLRDFGARSVWGGVVKDFVYRYWGKRLAKRPNKFKREEIAITLAKKYFGITFGDVAVTEFTSQAFFGILGALGRSVTSGFTGQKS